MKKLTTVLLLALTFFCACNELQAKNAAKKQTVSPEDNRINKIQTVLEQMSERAQAEIKIADYQDFLKDLEALLEEEKTFDPEDVSLFYLIDKKHNIGENYAPSKLIKLVKNNDFAISRNDLSLRPCAYKALVELAQAADKQGINTLVSSTYRSYNYQKGLFERYSKTYGQEEADRFSARAGTSQHQLGTAVDFGSITNDFYNTKLGIWMKEHAGEYGWSLSFPEGYEKECGYMWESWHFRYIGKNACLFQKKYFNNIQQFMLEFLHLWKNTDSSK